MYFTPTLHSIYLNPRWEFHHWNPKSEKFASLSNLASAVLKGWTVNSLVIDRTFSFTGGRTNHVYYFELCRDKQYMTMPIVQSPAIMTLIRENPFQLMPYRDMRESMDMPWSGKTFRHMVTT